jgi:hypothetical protein
VLELELSNLMLAVDGGAVKNVGPADTAGTVRLYDVADVEARAFGDRRVKVAAEDGDGNLVELALSPGEVRELLADVETIEGVEGLDAGEDDGPDESAHANGED